MITNLVSRGSDGKAIFEVQTFGIKIGKPDSAIALADAAIFTTEINDRTGLILVSEETAVDTALFTLVSAADVPVTTKLAGVAAFTNTKDTAASINVYYDATADAIEVQNLTGAPINIKIGVVSL